MASSPAGARSEPQKANGSETESSSRSFDSDKSGDGSGIHGQNVAENTPSNSTDDSNPVAESDSSTATGDLMFAVDLVQSASKAFKTLDFTASANLFKPAIIIMFEQYHEFAPELAQVCYKYGLALMYEVAVPIKDDLMAILPMEADYELHSISGIDGFISPEKHVDRLLKNQGCPYDDVRWRDSLKNLEKAWSILENQPDFSVQKVNILSALGELEFRQGKVNSYKYYQRALIFLENVVEPDNHRIAVLNFKICVCLSNSHQYEEAIYHCQKGLSVCETRVGKIEDESKGLPVGDPSIQQKKTEISMLTIVTNRFEILLHKMHEQLSSTRIPTPPPHSPSSVNQQITSPTRLGTIKDNQPQSSQQESPTSSTANTNKRAAGSGMAGPTTDYPTEATSTDSSPAKHRKKGDGSTS